MGDDVPYSVNAAAPMSSSDLEGPVKQKFFRFSDFSVEGYTFKGVLFTLKMLSPINGEERASATLRLAGGSWGRYATGHLGSPNDHYIATVRVEGFPIKNLDMGRFIMLCSGNDETLERQSIPLTRDEFNKVDSVQITAIGRQNSC